MAAPVEVAPSVDGGNPVKDGGFLIDGGGPGWWSPSYIPVGRWRREDHCAAIVL